MKKLNLWLLIVVLFSTTAAMGQTSSQRFKGYLGGGLTYSVLNYSTGFTGKVGIEAFGKVRLVGNYTYYLRSFEQSGSGKLEKSAYELDVLFQYLVETSDWANIYFSAGYNRYHKSLHYSSGREEQFDFNRMKLGTGVQINFQRVSVFGDYHFAFAEENDHVLTMGLLFYLLQ